MPERVRHCYHNVRMSVGSDGTMIASAERAEKNGTLHKTMEAAFGATFSKVWIIRRSQSVHVFGRYPVGENPGLFDRCRGREEEIRGLLAEQLRGAGD